MAPLALAALMVAAMSSPSSSIAVPTASPIVPTASERALFEQGRSAERIMFGLERPQIFAIALLRSRSIADLTATEQLLGGGRDAKKFSGLLSKLETLRPFIDRGDESGVDRELWGSAFIEPYMLTAPPNPEQWWIVEAGMASIDTDAARVDFLAGDLQSIHPTWLAGHLSYAGRFSSIVPPGGSAIAAASQPQPLSKILASPAPGASPVPSLNETDLESYQADLSNRLAGVFTEPAFPAITYGTGGIADGRRGVASITASQMLDVPALLGQRDAQRFIDDLFASLKSTTTDAGALAALAAARAQFSVPAQAMAFAKDQRFDALYTDMATYGKTNDKDRQRRVNLGEAAALIFRNASSDRDTADDSRLRARIGEVSDLDTDIPGLAVARAGLASAKSGDWLDIRAKSLVVIDLIMGSD